MLLSIADNSQPFSSTRVVQIYRSIVQVVAQQSQVTLVKRMDFVNA